MLTQSKKAVEAQIKTLTLSATSIMTELTQCTSAIARETNPSTAAQKDLLRQLTTALLPLRQALGVPGVTQPLARIPEFAASVAGGEQNKRAKIMDTACYPAQVHQLSHNAAANAAENAAAAVASAVDAAATAATTAAANAAATARATAAAAAAAAMPARVTAVATRVVLVTSTDIRDVLAQMAESSDPAIYDFQGRRMHSVGRRDINIVMDGSTWRNVTFDLPGPKLYQGMGGSSLVVSGKNVRLEGVTISGGQRGVSIEGNGSLTMSHCRVLGANYGVHVEGRGWLFAEDLQVKDSSCIAFDLRENASVQVVGCDVSGSGWYGFEAVGSSRMVGSRFSVKGCRREVLRLFGTAKLTLKDSEMGSRQGRPGSVRQKASLVLSSCDVDGYCERDRDATIQIDRN